MASMSITSYIDLESVKKSQNKINENDEMTRIQQNQFINQVILLK